MDVNWFNALENYISKATGDPLLSRIILAVAIGILTVVVAHICIKIFKKFLERHGNSLAKSSFYKTIIHILVWGFGLCVILDMVFHVNMSAVITALGVGGIALSLGFQDTLSNLFGGVTMTITSELKPGDNIKVAGYTGVIQDIQWRQTTIYDGYQTVIVPNSVLSKNAVVVLPPIEALEIPITVENVKNLKDTTDAMIAAVQTEVGKICKVTQKPTIQFSGYTNDGILTGYLYVTIDKFDKIYDATDAATRAIAPYTVA